MVKRLDDTGKLGGKVSWKPASNLGYLNIPNTHKGRWAWNEEQNLAKKLAEGWEFVNKTNFPQLARLNAAGGDEATGEGVKDGKHMGGAVRYREMIGMMLSKDLVEAREEYFAGQTRAQTESRVRQSKQKQTELGKHADAITGARLIIE